MKHLIKNIEDYFYELDNYDYMAEFIIGFSRWQVYAYIDEEHFTNRRKFYSPKPTTFIRVSEEWASLQKYIDNKKILIAAEQLGHGSNLFPVDSIETIDTPSVEKATLRIFYNKDMLKTIAKLKIKS